MGILDSITSQVLGGDYKNNPNLVKAVIVNAVIGVIGNQNTGGLAGLAKRFAGNGLGDIMESWIGRGENLPVTPEQVQKGLGGNQVNQLAVQTGLTPQQVASHLSALLPEIIDKLTPNGTIEQQSIMSRRATLLVSLFK